MSYSVFDTRQSREVVKLFTNIFSESEGKAEGTSVGNLVSELIATNTNDLVGFVVTDQDKVIACIFFSRLTFQNNANAFILSPVAVDTNYQGKRIGQQIISFGIEYLKEQDVELVFTYGDPNFYKKVGFKHISKEYVKAPQKLTHLDRWLGQSLTDDKIKPITGSFRCVEALYKPEYW